MDTAFASAQPELEEQAGPPPVELTDEGEYYAQLLQDCVTHADRIAAFAKSTLREIVGEHGNDPLLPLESTDDRAEDVNKPVSIQRRLYKMMLPAMSPIDQEPDVSAVTEDAKFEAIRQKHRAKKIMKDTEFEASDRYACSQAYLSGVGPQFVAPAMGILSLVANADVEDGQPMTLPICVHDGDYAFDPTARRPQEERMRAFRVRIPKRDAVEFGYINSDELREVEWLYNTAGDEDVFALWVVVVYQRKRIKWGIAYKPGENRWYMPLQEWTGHPDGPIITIDTEDLRSEQNLPNSPAMQVGQLHMAFGAIMRNNAQRAIIEKTVLAGQGADREFEERLAKARHLQLIPMATANMPQPVTYGGPTPGQQEILLTLQSEINNETPNLQQSSGNKGISDTAREAMILENNARNMLALLERSCQKARNKVLTHLMYYDFYGEQELGGVEVGVPVSTQFGTTIHHSQITPQDRMADFIDMSFEVKVNQARKLDPAVKLDLLTQFGQMLPATIAGIAQVGGNPDPYLREMSEYSGMSSLAEMFPTGSGQVIQQIKQQEAMMAQAEGAQGGAQDRKARGAGMQSQPPLGAMGMQQPMPNQPAMPGGVA